MVQSSLVPRPSPHSYPGLHLASYPGLPLASYPGLHLASYPGLPLASYPGLHLALYPGLPCTRENKREVKFSPFIFASAGKAWVRG